MKSLLALFSALAGIVSALPFLIRTWQAHRLRREKLRRAQEIHDAVYSGDRDRMADLLQRLRAEARGLR